MSASIAICNQKGGVGKSTTAVNVGAYLARSGRRTLLVDLDPQGNATISCGFTRSALKQTVYDALIEEASAADVTLRTQIERLSLLPSSIDLAGAELKLAQSPQRELILKTLCGPLAGAYEVVLFDCPPSLGLLTVNALAAAEFVLIPVQCEYLALEGLTALIQAIDLVKHGLNPTLEVGGIVLTMADFRANLTKEVSDEVRRFFKHLVFDTAIPRNVRLAECPSFGKPICLYDPSSSGALAYELLANELITRVLNRRPSKEEPLTQTAGRAP